MGPRRAPEGVAAVAENASPGGDGTEVLAGVAVAVRSDIAGSAMGRRAVGAYVWVLGHAPRSTAGKLLVGAAVLAAVLAPSLGLLYVTLSEGREATQDFFGALGYAGVFIANLASTATVFIPVPGLTAAGQTLIASSGLHPFAVGIAGGLGMALGEVTAYVAGMAGSQMAVDSGLQAPRWARPAVERVISWIDRLMDRYGMPTLFVLSAVPNVVFEFAGLTAGANRMHFGRFMTSVAAGKCVRGLILAYVGTKLIFG
jgi:membrane protein DedA with SNARE-associated domain